MAIRRDGHTSDGHLVVLILEVGEGGRAQVQARGNALAQLPALRFQVLLQPARNAAR